MNLCTFAGSAALSVFGVYVVGSLDVVLLGTVVCIVARSLWSEIHLNRRFGIPSGLIPLQEVALTAAFVALALVAPGWAAVAGYAALFAAYLLVNRAVTLDLLGRARRVLVRR